MPLTDVGHQVQTVLTATGTALGLALVGAAAIAWLFSIRISQRVRLIAQVAQRYESGDLTPPRLGFGDDELGTVARALDQSVQEVGRRLAEQARDRARMEAILAGMVEGVIVVDAQGRLQLVNDAAKLMLKLRDVSIGRQYSETIRVPAIADLVAEVLLGHRPEALQLSPPRDPSRAIMARAAPAAGSAEYGVILVLHDITDLKRADQIRRDFVANVSHELRTPLTAIRGYVEALSEDDTNPEDRRRFLEIIGRQTLRMERLVKDLLRLARLDAGQETLDLVACDTPSARSGSRRRPRVGRRGTAAACRRDDRTRGRRGPRRSGETPRRSSQPRGQRHHLLARAEYNPRRSDAGRRPDDDVRVRSRAGHPRGGSLASLRAFLSRGQVARARSRRHRSRSGHRETPRRAARRRRPRRKPRGRRREIHDRSPDGDCLLAGRMHESTCASAAVGGVVRPAENRARHLPRRSRHCAAAADGVRRRRHPELAGERSRRHGPDVRGTHGYGLVAREDRCVAARSLRELGRPAFRHADVDRCPRCSLAEGNGLGCRGLRPAYRDVER